MDAAMNNQEILAMIRQEIAANNAAQEQARSFSNGTTNFGLPQWEPNDKPTFLVDMNGAYRTIDTQMQANKNDANSAITAAESANTLSNLALTASRENAQNIVTLTNNLTETNNKITALPSLVWNSNFTAQNNHAVSDAHCMVSYNMGAHIAWPIRLQMFCTTLPTTRISEDQALGQFTFPVNIGAGAGAHFKFIIAYYGQGNPTETGSVWLEQFKIITTGKTLTFYLKSGFAAKSESAIILTI